MCKAMKWAMQVNGFGAIGMGMSGEMWKRERRERGGRVLCC